jgi:uncharacterized protein
VESGAADRALIGAVPVSARALAPDLARGAMLLLIALANVPLYLYGDGSFGDGIWLRGHPIVDQTVLFGLTVLVRGRAYPMFAFLFGYGIVQLQRRLASTGVDDVTVQRLIRRRGTWMVLIGCCHALLLFSGDIIGAYGLLAVLLAGMLVRARERTLLIISAVWVVPLVLFRTLEGQLSPLHGKATSTTDVLQAAEMRILEWVQHSVVGSIFILVPAVLLGVCAARRRLLDEPQCHHRFLLPVALLGVALAAAGGLPWALVKASWWDPPSEAVAMTVGVVQTLTGFAGGLGYAAIAGLVAIRVQHREQRPGRVISALVACGQRSMTCYLLQSVVFVTVLASYGGGLGNRVGYADIAALAVATWVLTVLVAAWMSGHGYRGPAEVLLRRLTYRAAGSAAVR